LDTDWKSLGQVDAALDAVNAHAVRETCMKYIYDKCPVVSSYGM